MSNKNQGTEKSGEAQLTHEQAWKAIEVMRLMSHADHRVKLAPISKAIELCQDATLVLDPGEPAEILISRVIDILEGMEAAETMFEQYRQRNAEGGAR